MNAWIKTREKWIAGLVLLLALGNGLVFLFLIPPWQHYDEPMHFEYAWLLANRPGLPVPGEYDRAFRADLVRSMIAEGFYDGGGLQPPDPENLRPLPAGLQYPQLDDPPLYYLLASIPLRLLRTAGLADQLLAARTISLLLFLVSVIAAWGLARELTGAGSPYRVLVPLTLALLPGYVELMTAVNNDVGAAAVSSLFLWGGVRLIRRGPSLWGALWVLAAAVAAVFTKITAVIVLPLAGVALLVGLTPRRFRGFAWAGLVGIIAVVLAGLVVYNEPAYWYRATTQQGPVRVESPRAPHGAYALAIDPAAPMTPAWLLAVSQPIPLADVQSAAGQPVTVGFWMWYERPGSTGKVLDMQSSVLAVDLPMGTDPNPYRAFRITDQPTFHAFTVNIPADVLRMWISLRPQLKGAMVYFDGFVVSVGEYPIDQPPVFDGGGAAAGLWGGRPFINLVRNPSMEQTWPAFRPAFDNAAARLLPDNVRPSILLHTLFDWEGTGWYYREAGSNILQTFWGKFGWGHIPYPRAQIVYPLFGWLTLLAAIGALAAALRRFKTLPLNSIAFLALALIAALGMAVGRGAIYIFVARVFIPGARYAYPAILPAALVLSVGFWGWTRILPPRLRLPDPIWIAFFAAGLFLLDLFAWLSIVRFYG